MQLSDILYNPFHNVTPENIEKYLHILCGLLMGDHEQNPQSDGDNYCIEQDIVEIETEEIYYKLGNEVCSDRCTQLFKHIAES